MRRPPLGRLHVLTDRTLQTRFEHRELAALAAAGGADVVQYREKRSLPFERRLAEAARVVAALDGTGTRCIVNDDPQLALRCGAHGVHVGSGDAAPAVARSVVGSGLWLGATANDERTALRLAREPIDYLGVGPVFGTRSKAAPAARLGPHRLRRIVESVACPVIAIGAIEASNVDEVLATGVWGVAVLSAVVCAADPAAATAALRERIAHATGVTA